MILYLQGNLLPVTVHVNLFAFNSTGQIRHCLFVDVFFKFTFGVFRLESQFDFLALLVALPVRVVREVLLVTRGDPS